MSESSPDDATGVLTVTNATISENFGGLSGGGILSSGPVTVASSTIYSNTAGGLVNGGSQPFTIQDTILANNSAGNCNGTITSLGHNLEDGNSCAPAAVGDLSNTDPKLGPLASNGGPTQTHALLSGSPAIDAGDNASCPATDQRGVARIGKCDIGAYEFVERVYLSLMFRN